MTDIDSSATNDVFVTSRYAELVENPIMYSSQTILHLQLTEWKSAFILRLEEGTRRKHNARDENDDDCTEKFLGK
jgi:hypothetical protein